MDERLTAGLEKLMARVARLGADLWEIYGESWETRRAGFATSASGDLQKPSEGSVRLADPAPGPYSESLRRGWAVRLKKAGRLIFVAGNDEAEILARLESAIRAPLLFPETDWSAPAVFDPHHLPILPDDRQNTEPCEVRLKVLHEIGVLPSLSYYERCRRRVLFNSLGLRAQDTATFYEVWGERRPVSLQRSFSALLEDLLRNYHRVIREKRALPPIPTATTPGQIPWLLTAEAAVSLLSALLLAADRDGALPASVSPEIDLIDDGILPGGFATDPFDGQGEKTSRIVIYQDGRPPLPRALLRSFSLGEVASPSWTHWRRATYLHLPRRHYTNAVIPPGDLAVDELLESLPEAVFVSDIHATVSADGARITLTAEGKKFCRGEESGPAIMFSEAGVAADLWNRVTARCRGFAMLGNLGAPPLLLDLTNGR